MTTERPESKKDETKTEQQTTSVYVDNSITTAMMLTSNPEAIALIRNMRQKLENEFDVTIIDNKIELRFIADTDWKDNKFIKICLTIDAILKAQFDQEDQTGISVQ